MSTKIVQADVVVVGAGTAGAHVAQQLAAQGREVILLERRSIESAGAHWINGLLDWQFDRAGIPRSAGAERVAETSTMHLRTPDDQPAVTVQDCPVVAVDMARLGERLRDRAVEAGVITEDGVQGLKLVERGGRVVGLDAELASGPVRFIAELFVDASGRAGVLRKQSSVLASWCPPIRGGDLCSASDVVYRITDEAAARRQLDVWDADAGDAVNVLGATGGFSTRSVTVSPDFRQARVLVGCIADGHHSTAPRMLAEVRRLHPWMGEQLHGGVGVIPLRRPYGRFVAPGLALVGDAAGQVFAAHGSGVGMGLLGGTVLAESMAGESDIGDGDLTWEYQRRFMEEFGPDLAFFDGFRRLSCDLGTNGVRDLLASGVMTTDLARGGLDQRRTRPKVADVPRMLAGLVKIPKTAGQVLGAIARCERAAAVAGNPPRDPDEARIKKWDGRLTKLTRS